MMERKDWTYSVCGCCDDCSNRGCCTTCLICLNALFFAPCVLAENAAAVGEDSCLYCLFCMMFPACYFCLRSHIRTKIRKQRGIKGTETDDLLIVCCCPLLSLVQESRELKTPVREDIVRQ